MRTSPTHYIAPTAISITPNANNSANDLAVYIAPDTNIKVFCPRLGIGNSDGTFQEWRLRGKNRRLAESSKPYTIYARLVKTDTRNGYLVFAPKQQEDGEWKDKYPYITTEGLASGTAGAETGNYWYVKLGDVSLPDDMTNQRTVNLDTGILGTDFWNSEWALNPDALPLRIESSYKIGPRVTPVDQEPQRWDAGTPIYVRWEQVLDINAKLIEGWTGTDITRFHHWELTRNTESAQADASWNAAHNNITTTEFTLSLAHPRGTGDDFNGRISAIFTFTAYKVNPEYEDDHSKPQYLPLISTTFSVMAEPVDSYELEVSSETVTYNPQSGVYTPAMSTSDPTKSGVTVRVRAKDSDGNTFYPTYDQLNAIGLKVYYQANDGTGAPAPLDLRSGRGTLPSAPFLAGKGVNTWLQIGEWSDVEDGNIILTSRTITYIRFGAKGDTPISCYRWYKDGVTPVITSLPRTEEPAQEDLTNASPTDGWKKTAPDRPSTGEWALWMCSSIKHGDDNSIDAWAGPIRISGIKGDAGEDAEDREYIYRKLPKYPFDQNPNESLPANINTGTIPDPDNQGQRISSNDKTKDDWVPTGWSDTAMSADNTDKYVYISIRTKEPGQNWGAFSSPVLWSNWGEKGMDGDGVQYLFRRFATERTAAELTALKTELDNGKTFNETTGKWQCTNWTDNPVGPDATNQYEYCAVIKRINGTWGNFETPSLWSKWSKDGTSITKKSETPYYIKNTTGTRPAADDPNWSTSTTKPTIGQGEWLFTKIDILWSDGSHTYLYTDERNPNDGQAGESIVVDGATVMKYYVSVNNAQHPADGSSDWKDYSQITLEKGKWLWAQAKTNYKRATTGDAAGSTYNYNVSYIAEDGTDAQYIYLKGTAHDVSDDLNLPCEVKINGGTDQSTHARGLNLVTINRQTLAKVKSINYDTYGEAVGTSGETGITDLITKLGTLDDSVFVCLVSYDAVGWSETLITALQGYGMGDLPYTETGRYKFLFIGYKNLGKGNGLTRMRNIGSYTDVVELAAYVANGALTLRDGKDGKDGRSITSVTEYYKASNLDGSDAQHSETAPADGQEAAQGWSTNPNTAMRSWNEANKYLWNYEKVTYSSGTLVERTTPQILAIWTKDGAAGKGIDSIQNKYCVTNSPTPPAKEGETGAPTWYNTPQAPGQGEYLWNYEIITWINPSTTTDTEVQQIGYAGIDGASPVFADIDNEMDSVACDIDGYAINEQDVETHLRMFRGNTLMTGLSIISIVRESTEDTFTAADYSGSTWEDCEDKSEVKIKVSYQDNIATIIFRFLHDLSGESVSRVEHFFINASAGGETRQMLFTVNGVRPGADGEPAVLYSLTPSASEIVKKKNGSTEPNTNITCSVIKTEGDNRTTATTGFELRTTVDGTVQQSGSTVNPANVNTSIVYELYVPNITNGTLVDRETIPVVTDGTDGTNADMWTIGADGYWYKNNHKYTDADHPNGIQAEGKNGTGIEMKGSVDVILNIEIVGTQTSLEGLTGLTYGDCYMVKSNGWLYFYDGTTPPSAATSEKPANPAGWNPVGEIKGEPGDDGVTYYYHTAFADSITLNNGVVTAQSGFTTVNNRQEGYAWVGYCATTSNVDPGSDATSEAAKLAAAQQYKWNRQKGADGADAVVYKIDFTDKTFALNPNTGRNVISIKGVVYRTEGSATPTRVTLQASHFAMRFKKSDGTVRELSSGSDFGINANGEVETYFGNGETTLRDYNLFIVEYKPDGTNILAQESLPLTVYGEKGMDAITGYADYLYDADDSGSMPAPSAEELGKINLKRYSGSSQNRIEICEVNGSGGYVWKGYGKDTYPDGTQFVCKVDNHIYRASATGWVDEGRFKGDNAVVYKIEFTDSTFAYDPNNQWNVVDIRGIVYKIDGGNTSVFASLGTNSTLEMYFLLENGNREQIPANLITTSNGSFSTTNRDGAATRGEKTVLAIVKIGNDEVARASIPRSMYGENGTNGSRGKRGRSYYYAQPWENDDTIAYLVNDSVAPYFLYNDEYYVYNPVGDIDGPVAMSAMGTPSTDNPNWEIMQNDFKYIITEAIFGKYADFGSFRITGNWLYSELGEFLGENTEDHPNFLHKLYDFRKSYPDDVTEVNLPACNYIHPEDPNITYVTVYDNSEESGAFEVTTKTNCIIDDDDAWLNLKSGVIYSFGASFANCKFYLRKNRVKRASIVLYKRSSTTISAHGITTTLYYKFSDGKLYTKSDNVYTEATDADLNNWKLEKPADNGNACYIIQAAALGAGDYDQIETTEWSEANILHLGDAVDVRYVRLYKRSSSAVTTVGINTALYYKFSTQKLYTDAACTIEATSSDLNGWSLKAPTGSTDQLYLTAAIANYYTERDKITSTEWVTPTPLTVDDLTLVSSARVPTSGLVHFELAEDGEYQFIVEKYVQSGSSSYLNWVIIRERYFLAYIAINGRNGYILQRNSHGNYNGTGNFTEAGIGFANIDKMHSGTAYADSSPMWVDINNGILDISRYSKVRIVQYNNGWVEPVGYLYVDSSGTIKVSSIAQDFYNPNKGNIPAT